MLALRTHKKGDKIMAKIWLRLILCFLVFQIFPGNMRASVHIEPFFGKILNFSKASQTESSVKYERDLDGVLYGTRLGYGLLGFSAGVEFAASQFDAEVKNQSVKLLLGGFLGSLF